MDEQDFTQNNVGDTTGNTMENTASATATKVKDNIASVKDKLSSQACTLGNQLGQKIDTARGKTSERLRTTSKRINNLAMYMEEHDAKDMSETALRSSRELIRKHPGKSLLVGLLAGVLVGRMFSMVSGRPFVRSM